MCTKVEKLKYEANGILKKENFGEIGCKNNSLDGTGTDVASTGILLSFQNLGVSLSKWGSGYYCMLLLSYASVLFYAAIHLQLLTIPATQMAPGNTVSNSQNHKLLLILQNGSSDLKSLSPSSPNDFILLFQLSCHFAVVFVTIWPYSPPWFPGNINFAVSPVQYELCCPCVHTKFSEEIRVRTQDFLNSNFPEVRCDLVAVGW